MAKELNFKQELTACFGYPVAENPTQAMIEPAYRKLGLDWRYLTLEVKPENLQAAVDGARAFGFQGFNCTIPHKVAVIEHLDGLGESASLMGAVNCVVNRDGKLIGENTDGKGFVSSLKEVTDPAGKSVVIFGAGGASRAITVELALAGVTDLTVVNRDPLRGEALSDLLNTKVKAATGGSLHTKFEVWDNEFQIPDGTDIVINATSISLNVSDLPAATEVYNASATMQDGSWMVQHDAPVAAGAAVEVVLEYYSRARGMDSMPTITVEHALPLKATPTSGESSFAVDRIVAMEDGSMLVEFPAVPGKCYLVQYSSDNRDWNDCLVRVRAGGTRVQWIDQGSPKTPIHPLHAGVRFYRIIEKAEEK